MRFFFLLLFTLTVGNQSFAQKIYDNDVHAIYLNFNVGYHLPQGDMKARYGNDFYFGLDPEWITQGSNLIFGINGHFLYSNNVKEDVGALFRGQSGVLFGVDQTATALYLRERGVTYGIHIGKLFAINHKKNPRSGIRLTIGLGRMRHWIRISDEFKSANQFKGDYLKGYDRLTAGWAITPFLGYQYTSLNRYLNLIVGVEYTAGFTKSQRSWDYDLLAQDTQNRFDGLLGFKVGFSLPLYVGDSKGDIEY